LGVRGKVESIYDFSFLYRKKIITRFDCSIKSLLLHITALFGPSPIPPPPFCIKNGQFLKRKFFRHMEFFGRVSGGVLGGKLVHTTYFVIHHLKALDFPYNI